MEPPIDLVSLSDDPDAADPCAVCQAPLEREIARLSKCAHVFHDACIQKWEKTCRRKKRKLSCPVCRVEPSTVICSPEHDSRLLADMRIFLAKTTKREAAMDKEIAAENLSKRDRLDAIHAELRALQDMIAGNKTRWAFYNRKIPKLRTFLSTMPKLQEQAMRGAAHATWTRYKERKKALFSERIAYVQRVRTLRVECRQIAGKPFVV